MAKKFITAVLSQKKYRVFLDDVKTILKRCRKNRPPIPSFTTDLMESLSSSCISLSSEKTTLGDEDIYVIE
jgi:hypothetical protein